MTSGKSPLILSFRNFFFSFCPSLQVLCEALPREGLCIPGLRSFESPVRRFCIVAINTPLFSRISLGTILANCVFLSITTNAPGFNETSTGRAVVISECAPPLPASAAASWRSPTLGAGSALSENLPPFSVQLHFHCAVLSRSTHENLRHGLRLGKGFLS